MSLDFREVLTAALDNEQNAKKSLKSKAGISTEFSTPVKRQVDKKKKGVESAAVRAFLEKQEKEEKMKELEAKRKKIALLKARAEAKHNRKAHAMASRTKDNLKVFNDSASSSVSTGTDKILSGSGSKSSVPDAEDDEEVKVGSMFSKNKRRVAHKSNDKILEARKVVKPVKNKTTNEDLWNVQSDSDREIDLSKPLVSALNTKTKKDEKNSSSQVSRNKSYQKEHNRPNKEKNAALIMANKSEKHLTYTDNKEKKKEKYKSLEDRQKEREERKARKEKEEKKKMEEAERRKQERMEEKLRKKKEMARKRATQTQPSMSFHQLLAIASENRNKPSEVVEEKQAPKTVQKPKKEEERRPMTQEEKERYERRKTKEYQQWLMKGGRLPIAGKSADYERTKVKDNKAKGQVGENNDERYTKLTNKHNKEAKPTSDYNAVQKNNTHAVLDKRKTGVHDDSQQQGKSNSQKQLSNGANKKQMPFDKSRSSSAPANNRASSANGNNCYKKETKRPDTGSSSERSGHASGRESSCQAETEHSNPWDRIYSQVKKNNPKPVVKRRIEDSDEDEEEYDSEMDDFIEEDEDEMDDFIDDSQAADYSKHIKQIFGYDKNKYRYERDDDLDDMETNYSQIMKEEARSARIGRQEDLEDMRMEEEEQRRKLLRKKQAKKMRK